MRFAEAALEVMREVLLVYGGRPSEHTFIRPRLVTQLCLMRFEDWTPRDAEALLDATRRRA